MDLLSPAIAAPAIMHVQDPQKALQGLVISSDGMVKDASMKRLQLLLRHGMLVSASQNNTGNSIWHNRHGMPLLRSSVCCLISATFPISPVHRQRQQSAEMATCHHEDIQALQ